jgi:zinc protease
MRTLTKASFLIITFVFFLSLISSSLTTRQKTGLEIPQTARAEEKPGHSNPLEEPLPIDPEVLIGTLQNGLTYYVRVNRYPEKRAELRLVVNAGSVLEDGDQLGLAHFLEHMAFTGTKNFKKEEIVGYLESIGVRFGPDLNAYTTFDETVYMLQVPTDSDENLEKALGILEDWAHQIVFNQSELEKERGVVVEERRLRRDAESRIRDKQIQTMYRNSRYADRLPIGKLDIIQTFEPEVLRRFYKDWYRPDLMAVIAVGDFDKGWMEKSIKKYFSRINHIENPRERTLFSVPDHEETLIDVTADTEATQSRVRVMIKHDVAPFETVGNYRTLLVGALYNRMLNARFDELSKKPDPPFLEAYSAKGRVVQTKELYILNARVKDNGIERGLQSLITEVERVKRYGFTESELGRAKKELLKGIEQIYNERDKIESGSFVSEYTGHFLRREPIPGIEYEYDLYKEYIPGITLTEVNGIADQWLTKKNRVILASLPEKPGIKVPSKEDLVGLLQTVQNINIEPYEDLVSELPLVSVLPNPGRISDEKLLEELGVTEWRLSNGVRVVLKPTDFKNDQIFFGAYSPGGHSLALDEHLIAARTAARIINESGVGDLSQIQLEKKLAGKAVSVTPRIDELFEGISGSSTPEDLETMFQLIYLYFTLPRKDPSAFLAYKERLSNYVKNRMSSPEAVFWDTVQRELTMNHRRAQPWSLDMLEEMDLEKSYDFYRDRFSDASDFTFFFVGAIDVEKIKPLVKAYIGGLPSIQRTEKWRDHGIDTPFGITDRTVFKGIESKSMVQVIFNGTIQWSLRNVIVLSVLGDVLEIPLRDTLREELGGTYNIWVYAAPSRYPDSEYRVYIGFGSAPEQALPLTMRLFQEIKKIQEVGPKQSDLEKVKEILRRERETNMKDNSFWLNVLESYYTRGMDPLGILQYEDIIKDLTIDDIRTAARNFLDMNRYVKVVLYPEEWKP